MTGSKVDVDIAIKLRKRKKTLREIGEKFGVSRERVRQLLKKKGDFSKYNYPNRLVYLLGYKGCCDCKKTLKFNKFYNDKSSSSGYSDRCIYCTKKQIKKYSEKYKKEYLKNGKYYQKQKSRQAVYQAIKRGDLVKGVCKRNSSKCMGQIEAHHYLGHDKKNYLNVRWYCRKHHRELDESVFFAKSS